MHIFCSFQVAIAYNNLATAVDGDRDYNRAVELVTASLDVIKQLRASQQVGDQQDTTATRDQDSERRGEEYSEEELDYYTAVFSINLGTIHSNNGEQ